jgi:hypothetical protein
MSSTTKKQLAAATAALLGVFAFQSSAAVEQKLQKLTGAQIQAKFPGMELTDEAHWGESSSETARSRSLPWLTRAPASGGSRRTSFVSKPAKNRVAVVTRCGCPEETWS